MKMKELNVWLAVGGFFQLAVLGCTGAIVNEMLKSDGSSSFIVLATIVDVSALCIGVGIYLTAFKKVSKS